MSQILRNTRSGFTRQCTRLVVILLLGAFITPGLSSCSRKYCAAYSSNVDGKVKRKKRTKKNRRRQEGLDKKVYRWGK